MDESDQWHTMYKTSKLVVPSTQTDILPQHNFCVDMPNNINVVYHHLFWCK